MANTKKTTGKRRGPKPKKTEYYVDPRELKKELISYYKCENCSPALGDMIHKIAHGLSIQQLPTKNLILNLIITHFHILLLLHSMLLLIE